MNNNKNEKGLWVGIYEEWYGSNPALLSDARWAWKELLGLAQRIDDEDSIKNEIVWLRLEVKRLYQENDELRKMPEEVINMINRAEFDCPDENIAEEPARNLDVIKQVAADESRTKKKSPVNDWWDIYDIYIKSVHWSIKRNIVLARAKNEEGIPICEACGQSQAIQVHHLTYRNLGNEYLWELKAVCLACHQRLHPNRQMIPKW